MSDIFISYSREDRPVAQFLAAQLERAGFDVFWDRELLAGEDFEQKIQAELAEARAVVVLWSVISVRSLWVRDEASAAAERGVLLPVRLNGATVPMGTRSLHVIQFDQADQSELLRAIVRLTAKEPRKVPFPIRKATGIGIVEGACLLLVAAAVGAFLLMMTR